MASVGLGRSFAGSNGLEAITKIPAVSNRTTGIFISQND